MISEAALKKLNQKNEFLQDFSKRSGVRLNYVFPRLRVTHDYVQHKEIDAAILNPWNVTVLEIVTWTGRYRKDPTSKKHWIREERLETDSNLGSAHTTTPTDSTKSVSTIIDTRVDSPVAAARLKTKALKQYIESIVGSRNDSDFDYYALVIREECVLTEDCLEAKVITAAKLEGFMHMLKVGWTQWFLQKLIPMWPVWLASYNRVNEVLDGIPTYDVIVLQSGSQRLYGELRKCSGVPYDRDSTSVIKFSIGKTSMVFGSSIVNAQTCRRGSGGVASYQLDTSSELEFQCVEGDSPTLVKLTDIKQVILSRPTKS